MNEITNLEDFSVKQTGSKILASSLIAGILGYQEAKIALKMAKTKREQMYAKINAENKAKELEQIRAHGFRMKEIEAGKTETQTEADKIQDQIKIYDAEIKKGRTPRIAAMLAGLDYPDDAKTQSDFEKASVHYDEQYTELNKNRQEGEPEVIPYGFTSKKEYMTEMGHFTAPEATADDAARNAYELATGKSVPEGEDPHTAIAKPPDEQKTDAINAMYQLQGKEVPTGPMTPGEKIESEWNALLGIYNDPNLNQGFEGDFYDFLIFNGKGKRVPKKLTDRIAEAADLAPQFIEQGFTPFQAFAYALNPEKGIPDLPDDEVIKKVAAVLPS
ncbi:MAG: hypothetical protein OXG15_07395 [Gammaproteobacteria bacterium]|nr:hypothetical protein [Gammaproteobacteria bacterium]